MSRVYKYPICHEIELPKDAVVLSVHSKCDGVFLYAQVPENVTETEPHFFKMVATGDSFDASDCTYVGSFIEEDYFIYHVYEKKERQCELLHS